MRTRRFVISAAKVGEIFGILTASNMRIALSQRSKRAPLPNGSVALSRVDREALRRLMAVEHVAGASKLIGVSRSTCLAAAAGSGVRRASAEMIERRLSELASEGRSR